MSRWWTVVVLLVLVVTITMTTTVECNYSVASGGGKAVASEVKGDTKDAKQRGHHIGKLAQESAEKWTDWAKEKIQGVIGLIGAHTAQADGGEAKEKASQTVDEASKKLKGKYEQVKEKTYEVIDEEL